MIAPSGAQEMYDACFANDFDSIKDGGQQLSSGPSKGITLEPVIQLLRYRVPVNGGVSVRLRSKSWKRLQWISGDT